MFASTGLWAGPVGARQNIKDCAGYLMSEELSPLNAKITYASLPAPELTGTIVSKDSKREKWEVADITAVDDPIVQHILNQVFAAGGKVRLLQARITPNDPMRAPFWNLESPYFWVNQDPNSPSFLIPVIAIDLTVRGALPALAHEFQHFLVFQDELAKALARGLDRHAATRVAVDRVWDFDMIVEGETRAVTSEMQTERAYPDNPFNRPQMTPRPNLFWQRDYVNRVSYPRFQAVRQLLRNDPRGELDAYLNQMIDTAYAIRRQALAYLPADHELVAYWRDQSSIEALLGPYDHLRLEQDLNLERFRHRVRVLCRTRVPVADLRYCR